MKTVLRIGSISLAATLALVAGACGSDAATPSSTSAAGTAGALEVLAAFYPLQFVAERVGGERVSVTNLTPPGAEPHDVELTPQDVKRIADAGLVVYLPGFSPAVDEAIDQNAGERSFDVSAAAGLDRTYTPIEEGELAPDEEGADPHFWLDPTRLASVADALVPVLSEADPAGASEFSANAAALRADLEALDAELRTGLADCANDALVTTHNAFGYLAERYGLEQIGISGLTPEDEPTPARLAELAAFVEDRGIRTIYYEMLVSPAVAETLAAETGAATAVLDPLEGLAADEPNADYFSVMRANLGALRAGQPCT